MAAISKAKDMRIGTVGSVLFEAMELVGAGTTLTYVLSSFLLTPSNKHGTNSDDDHQIIAPPISERPRQSVLTKKLK